MATSTLSSVPVSRRRRSAVVAALFSGVLILAGVLPWATPADSVIRFLAAFVIVAGLLAGLIAFGLWRSIKVVPPRRAAPANTGGGCGGNCQCGSAQPGC